MIDKRRWGKHNFIEIVENIKDKAKPAECGGLPYIGLEHLSSESFSIDAYGISDDVSGDKIRIQKGDVLFGKRRAYQRKVGISPFDGIFSAHGMVFRPKEKVIIKELLPFFIKSDAFMERVISISVGSLSPTVNWSNLKNMEFVLPPIDEQIHIADVLQAAYNAMASYINQANCLLQCIYSYGIDVLFIKELSKKQPNIPSGWMIGTLSDLVQLDPHIPKMIDTKTASFISMDMINDDGSIIEKKAASVAMLRKGYTYFEDGDVIFAKITPCMENGKGFIAKELINGIGFGSTEFFVLRPLNDADRDFIYAITKSKFYRYHAERWMQGSAGQRRVPKDFFSKKRIAIPPQNIRTIIGKTFNQLFDNYKLLQKNIDSSRKVLMDLIGYCFGEATDV